MQISDDGLAAELLDPFVEFTCLSGAMVDRLRKLAANAGEALRQAAHPPARRKDKDGIYGDDRTVKPPRLEVSCRKVDASRHLAVVAVLFARFGLALVKQYRSLELGSRIGTALRDADVRGTGEVVLTGH